MFPLRDDLGRVIRGLICVVGPMGSGKTAYINRVEGVNLRLNNPCLRGYALLVHMRHTIKGADEPTVFKIDDLYTVGETGLRELGAICMQGGHQLIYSTTHPHLINCTQHHIYLEEIGPQPRWDHPYWQEENDDVCPTCGGAV